MTESELKPIIVQVLSLLRSGFSLKKGDANKTVAAKKKRKPTVTAAGKKGKKKADTSKSGNWSYPVRK